MRVGLGDGGFIAVVGWKSFSCVRLVVRLWRVRGRGRRQQQQQQRSLTMAVPLNRRELPAILRRCNVSGLHAPLSGAARFMYWPARVPAVLLGRVPAQAEELTVVLYPPWRDSVVPVCLPACRAPVWLERPQPPARSRPRCLCARPSTWRTPMRCHSSSLDLFRGCACGCVDGPSCICVLTRLPARFGWSDEAQLTWLRMHAAVCVMPYRRQAAFVPSRHLFGHSRPTRATHRPSCTMLQRLAGLHTPRVTATGRRARLGWLVTCTTCITLWSTCKPCHRHCPTSAWRGRLRRSELLWSCGVKLLRAPALLAGHRHHRHHHDAARPLTSAPQPMPLAVACASGGRPATSSLAGPQPSPSPTALAIFGIRNAGAAGVR